MKHRFRRFFRKYLIGRLPDSWQLNIDRVYLTHFVRDYVEIHSGLLKALADPRKLAVDVGAHEGVFTLFLSRYFSGVHCFEPNPERALALRRKYSSAPVEIHQCALGARDETAVLSTPVTLGGPLDSRSTLTNYFEGQIVEQLAVRVATLDSYALQQVSFLKIDVEGFECDVLDGAIDTIQRERPRLYIEIEQRFHPNQSIHNIFDRIARLGYSGFFVLGGKWHTLHNFDIYTMQALHSDERLYVNNFLFIPLETLAEDLNRMAQVAVISADLLAEIGVSVNMGTSVS
jgi:FkbM family methyltransferase